MIKDELGLGKLVERLLVERVGQTFDNECHLSSDEAAELADALTALIAERDALAKALSGLLRGEYESAEPGLCDCVDNHGKPYQSQFLAERIAAAETCLSTLNLTVNHDG